MRYDVISGRFLTYPFGGKPSAPAPPDYQAAALAQGAANVDTARTQARLGNPNFTNALGQRQVNFGDNDTVSINDTLTPLGQERFDSEQRLVRDLGGIAEGGLGRIRDTFSQPFSMGSADDIQNRSEAAIMSRLEPQFARDEEAMRARLRNQGITQNTPDGGQGAWEAEMGRLDRAKQDARQQAVLGGLQTRPQTLQQELAVRNIPLNEVNALRTGSQVNLPQFQGYSGPGIQAPNIMGATQQQYQGELNQYNANQSSNNAMMGGLFSLGSAALGSPAGTFSWLSDSRLKTDVERVGTHGTGIGVYEYTIAGRRERGVMAQEVAQVAPHAVELGADGFLRVRYDIIDDGSRLPYVVGRAQ